MGDNTEPSYFDNAVSRVAELCGDNKGEWRYCMNGPDSFSLALMKLDEQLVWQPVKVITYDRADLGINTIVALGEFSKQTKVVYEPFEGRKRPEPTAEQLEIRNSFEAYIQSLPTGVNRRAEHDKPTH